MDKETRNQITHSLYHATEEETDTLMRDDKVNELLSEGKSCSICDLPFVEADRVVPTKFGSYVHEACAEDTEFSDELGIDVSKVLDLE